MEKVIQIKDYIILIDYVEETDDIFCLLAKKLPNNVLQVIDTMTNIKSV